MNWLNDFYVAYALVDKSPLLITIRFRPVEVYDSNGEHYFTDILVLTGERGVTEEFLGGAPHAPWCILCTKKVHMDTN